MLVRDLVALLNTLNPDAVVNLHYDGGYGGVMNADCVFVDTDNNTVSFDADETD